MKVTLDMSETLEVKNNIIENIDNLFETTHLILSEFQQPLFELKEQRENIKVQLQDLLAKNEHLRRKDFDQMMWRILAAQVEKEKETRDLLNNYLNEQRTNLNLLRENLARIKEALANGQGLQVKESQEALNQILTQQDKRKQEVTTKLNEFQGEQKQMTRRFLELLAKGRELRIKDLKIMLQEFDANRRKRLVQRGERKAEAQKRKESVRVMLDEYKKKRSEFAKTRIKPS